MSGRPYVIGLTGNIATGKSAVAAILALLGAHVIDADALAHQVTRASTPAWQRVVDIFGRDILQPDGEINRARLAARVFADPQALARLEAIVHPAVIAESERLLQELQSKPSDGAPVVVLEAIKLVESGLRPRCDELWVVTSPREQQVQRLMATRGLSEAEAELRIDAQPHQAEKVAVADVVIDNSTTLEQTQAHVTREWERILHARSGAEVPPNGLTQGGRMPAWRNWMESHPYLTMWAILAMGMVAIFFVASRGVDLLPSQRLFMALACVVLAGLCTWIISWEQ